MRSVLRYNRVRLARAQKNRSLKSDMPPRDASNLTSLHWPQLDESYLDEAGWVDAEVYNIAGSIWPVAQNLAERIIHDSEAAQRLMVKAVAIVSRKRTEDPGRLTNIAGYLFTTFRHLLMEEREVLARRNEIVAELKSPLSALSDEAEDELTKMILVHELFQRADSWTKRVLELRILGHTFEEIGDDLKMKSNNVRSRFDKRIRKLSQAIINKRNKSTRQKVRDI